MTLVLNDRVKETSSGGGTGTLNLDGSPLGFQTFLDGIGEGNETYYTIQEVDSNGIPDGNWEVGQGTVSAATLSRDTVLQSSNSDNLVTFVGSTEVFCTIPGSKFNHSGLTDMPDVGGNNADHDARLLTHVGDTEPTTPTLFAKGRLFANTSPSGGFTPSGLDQVLTSVSDGHVIIDNMGNLITKGGF